MALTISLNNASSQNQTITLFDNGGSSSLSFVTGISSFQNNSNNDVSTIVNATTLTTLVNSTFTFFQGITSIFSVNIPSGSNLQTIIFLVNQTAKISYPEFNFCASIQNLNGVSIFYCTIVDNGNNLWSSLTWGIYTLLLTQQAGGTFCVTNPLITAKSVVPLNEILTSVNGTSYIVTSLYLWSLNSNQLTQNNLSFARKNANGNFNEVGLDIVIDPYAKNSITFRTNQANDFIIDNNCLIQFILFANSAINMKFEYLAMGFDEIKEMEIGMKMQLEYAEKEAIDEKKANQFNEFYLMQ